MLSATTEESQYGSDVFPFPFGGRTNGIMTRNYDFCQLLFTVAHLDIAHVY